MECALPVIEMNGSHHNGKTVVLRKNFQVAWEEW